MSISAISTTTPQQTSTASGGGLVDGLKERWSHVDGWAQGMLVIGGSAVAGAVGGFMLLGPLGGVAGAALGWLVGTRLYH